MAKRLKVPYPGLSNRYGVDEVAAILRALRADTLSVGVETGPEVQAFEKEFAKHAGVKYAFAVCNCTSALELAAELCEIKPGDEVIVPAITFISTSLPFLAKGARIVFTDIDDETLNMTPEAIERAITKKTKAIVFVHFSGLPGDMDEICALARKHKLKLIEDCAHASGARYKGKRVGSFGDVGCFSFHTVKNMTTLGEGGMVATNDAKMAYDIPRLRWVGTTLYKKQEHFWLPFLYDVQRVRGYVPHNFNMNEVCAAVGRVQLAKLDRMNEERRGIANALTDAIRDIDGIRTPVELPDREHVFHLYHALFDGSLWGADVNDLIAIAYEDFGVQIVPHYLPTYRFSIYEDRINWEKRCPVTKRIYSQLATLPFAHLTTDKEIDLIASAVRRSVERIKARAARAKGKR